LVYSRLSKECQRVRTLLALEMIQRSAKNLIRWYLRDVKSSEEKDIKKCIVNIFNNLFGTSLSSHNFWSSVLLAVFVQKFGYSETRSFNMDSFHTPKISLFEYLTKNLGLCFKEVKEETFNKSIPFEVSDLVSLSGPRMKKVFYPEKE